MSDPLAPRNTEQAAAFLKDEVISGSHEWERLCLKLQRTARGIPAMYPTALSASMSIPKSERIYNIDDARRGMVGFSYDPRIPGTAGHIFAFTGRHKGVMITSTNDAKEPGAVDYVPFNFYKEQWGQTFQFAATWLNGYDFSDFNKPPEPVHTGSLGEQYAESMRILEKVYYQKRRKFGPENALVLALKRDLNKMKKRLLDYS